MADKDMSGMNMLREFAVRGKHLIKLTDIANRIEREHLAEVNQLKARVYEAVREIDRLHKELAAKCELTDEARETVERLRTIDYEGHVWFGTICDAVGVDHPVQIVRNEEIKRAVDRICDLIEHGGWQDVDVTALRELADSVDRTVEYICDDDMVVDLLMHLSDAAEDCWGIDNDTTKQDVRDMLTVISERIRKALEGAPEPDPEREAAADWVASHGGLGNVQMIVQWVEDNGPSITELDKRLMPDGMEWLRFEDGEPVKFESRADGLSDVVEKFVFTRSMGGVCQLQDKDGHMVNVMCGDRVKRPNHEVLGADGLPIRKGETVWYHDSPNANAFIVCETTPPGGYASVGIRLHFAPDGDVTWVDPQRLTHTPPDTQERIDEDKDKEFECYWGCEGGNCEECPSLIGREKPFEHYGVLACTVAQGMDIARREQELKARTMGGAR